MIISNIEIKDVAEKGIYFTVNNSYIRIVIDNPYKGVVLLKSSRINISDVKVTRYKNIEMLKPNL